MPKMSLNRFPPLPRGAKYPWADMDVGDWFHVPTVEERRHALRAAKRAGIRAASRRLEKGQNAGHYLLWRIA